MVLCLGGRQDGAADVFLVASILFDSTLLCLGLIQGLFTTGLSEHSTTRQATLLKVHNVHRDHAHRDDAHRVRQSLRPTPFGGENFSGVESAACPPTAQTSPRSP